MPAALHERRFPPPWRVDACAESFVVRDAQGGAVAYVYFNERPAIGTGNDRPTRDQARRIAANIAKLPQLLAAKTAAERPAKNICPGS